MTISIILPAFNEARLLPSTLAAVHAARKAFDYVQWNSEVIVCDNNSTDATSQIAREHGARVVFEGVNMIGRARNAGASVASGDWLVFIDADSQPSIELFAAMIEAILSGRVLAGGSTVRMDTDDLRGRIGTAFWNTASRLRRLMAGSFIFVETAAFRKIGGFSGQFYAAEEIDLTHRLRPLARASNRRIVILSKTPLLTSARKLKLYTPFEIGRLILSAAIRPKATLTNKEACHLWYDGRR
ncbi:MAG: glycosyltransferase [Verrucomicrobiota bacterium]|nr:glycosyltransferase [Verrucomicrobiota bacterium]